MTDEDVSARDLANDLVDHSPGQSAIAELLAAHSQVPERSILARLVGQSPLTPDTRPLYDTALGEVEVGDALEALGEGWAVLHCLPVAAGASDIDHLVIGPSGVYIVATRNHTNQTVWASQRTLMVGGIRYPDIRNMEYEMGRVERILSAAAGCQIEVSAILAVVAPKSLTVRQKHRDVEVLTAAQLEQWLTLRRRILAPADVASIAEAAMKTSTWHTGDTPRVDAAAVRHGFNRLRVEVARAWRLQLFWASTLVIVTAGAFIGVMYEILASALGA